MFASRPKAVFIDAGFTLVFPHGGVLAGLAAADGVDVEAAAVEAAVGRLYPDLGHYPWPSWPGSTASADNGPRFFRRILELAGASGPAEVLDRAGARIWKRHLERNVWARPAPGAARALADLRQAGLALAVVSNSEGTIRALMDDLGWSAHFGTVIDSWDVGLVKPDPRIFHLAAERVGVAPHEAVMVGDSITADVGGARKAGAGAALLDPYGLHRDAVVDGHLAVDGQGVPVHADFAGFAQGLIAGLRR